jgi:DNA-binding response OmpR family regulator
VARILVVEDHEDSRAGLALWLEIVGHTVEASADGLSALAVARARPPAIAIIDIGIPGLNGWEVARRLRDAFGRRIGLIALTSRQSAEDRARSLLAGFDAHLVKPANGEELFRAIKALSPA